jgi:hypothetical protein
VTIEHELLVDDMVALAAFHYEHAPAERRRRRLVQGFIVVVFIFLAVSALYSVINSPVEWTPLGVAISFVPLVCPAILLILVFTPALRRWQARRSVFKAFGESDPNAQAGRQRLTITDQSVTVESAVAEMTVAWRDVSDIVDTETHVFLCTYEGQVIVVPRRAFPDQAAFDAFIAQARMLSQQTSPQ